MDFTSPPLSLTEDGFSVVASDALGTEQEDMQRLQEELKAWKKRVEEAENARDDLLFSNLNAEEEHANAQEDLKKLKDSKEKELKESSVCKDNLQSKLHLLLKENEELEEEIKKLKGDLEEHSLVRAQINQINEKVADMKVKFSHMAGRKKGCPHMDTHCVFHATAKMPYSLNQNEALLTFEDEEVAQRLIKKGKHSVNMDSKRVDVKAVPVKLERGFKFKLHVTISGKKICVSEIPELPIPEEWMRDKLELNFSKTEQGGGGEVEHVSYNGQSRTAVITFLRPGASNNFAGCSKYPFFANGSCYELSVSPSVDLRLKNCQPYFGVSKKTILLKGIQEMDEEEENIQDMIEIHFQKPSNGGGEIERIKYVSKGETWVCFEEDAENAILRKSE